MTWTFVIAVRDKQGEPIPPRTKKTHNRIISCGGYPRVLPSEAYVKWNRHAVVSLARQMHAQRGFPIGKPVNAKALIYRDALRGDATGFYQAIADTLEDAGVVQNDKWIVSWDGTRLLKDPVNPRVEIELTEVVA